MFVDVPPPNSVGGGLHPCRIRSHAFESYDSQIDYIICSSQVKEIILDSSNTN